MQLLQSLEHYHPPDRLLYLWREVLGIEDGIEKHRLIFQGKQYLFADPKCIGDSLISKQNLMELETYSFEDVSSFIGVYNKLRKVINLHCSMVNEMLDASDLLAEITRHLIFDLDKHLDEEQTETIDSSDNKFKELYEAGLRLLLITFDKDDDSESTKKLILRVARNILNKYQEKIHLSFINVKIVSDLETSIINMMLYTYRHTNVDFEYFNNHSVFEILQYVNDSELIVPESTNSTTLVDRIDDSTLVTVLNQITNTKSSNLPITFQYFPRILIHYIEYLQLNGEKNDFYIKLIKSATVNWIEEKITTNEFTEQLSNLSLVPTAVPYIYKGHEWPTLGMRWAIYQLKEEVRLKDVYFMLWREQVDKADKFDDQLRVAETNKLQRSWIKWKNEILEINKSKLDADYIFMNHTLKNYFRRWLCRLFDTREMRKEADIIFIQRKFTKWENLIIKEKEKFSLLQKMNDVFVLRKFFKIWIAAQKRHVKALDWNKIKQAQYLRLWERKLDSSRILQNDAGIHYQSTLTLKLFHTWQDNSKRAINRLHSFNSIEKNYILGKSMKVWKKRFLIERKIENFHKTQQTRHIRWVFEGWHTLQKLNTLESIYIGSKNSQTLQKVIDKWKGTFRLNQMVNNFADNNLLSKTFHIWKLKYFETNFANDLPLQIKYLKIWKLNLCLQGCKARKDHLVMEKYFKLMRNKLEQVKSYSLIADNQRNAKLKSLTLQIWISHHQTTKTLVDLAGKFKASHIQRALLNYYFWKWRLDLHNSRRQKKFLDQHLKIYQTRYIGHLFHHWLNKLNTHKQSLVQADAHFNSILIIKSTNKWVDKYDGTLELLEVLQNILDLKNVQLVKTILSSWWLKLMKIKNDERNAINFVERWDKIRLRNFWEMWKLKKVYSPTKKGPSHSGTKELAEMMGVDSIEIGNVFENPLTPNYDRSQGKSLNVSMNLFTPTPVGMAPPITQTPRGLRTPRRRTKGEGILESATRVRKKELQERLERFRLYRERA